MLLGSLLPEMRAETEALVSDLSELVRLRQAISGERATLAADASSLGAERTRLAALVEARQAAITGTEQALKAEGDRAQDLARQAATLKDLIAKLEAESGPAARAAEAARRADETQHAALESGGTRDPARLQPALPFAATRGQLLLPVSGSLLKTFGATDGFGGSERGMSLTTRPGAVVAAPADGWVAYAGPYRTYGRLLILNAGGGYYVVLAGMERLSVELGQFVLAGEPVATMGDGSSKTAAAVAIGTAQPILYIEFRKDGVAIDPGPWWAKAELQKVRG
jgi:murein hydrolase activator